MVSICTGAAFVLAAAGLLDGRRATTHWVHGATFARLFPAVHLDADVLFVDDGDVLTSAGNAAGIDLLLHLIRRDHGTEVATRLPAAASSPRGGTAGSRSSSNGRCPSPATRGRRPPARGPWSGSTGRSRWPTSPRTPG